MISVRGRFGAAAGFVLLIALAVSAWAQASIGPDPGSTDKLQGRQAVACATVASGQRLRGRPQGSICRELQPPPANHDGFRPIEWILDPDRAAPEPAARTIAVAVHELACTGGRDPIPHLQRPEVRYLEKAVVITLWIEVLEGPATCPGNPVGRLRVKLPGPLDARQLYDGSSDPPRRVRPGEVPRHWPYR